MYLRHSSESHSFDINHVSISIEEIAKNYEWVNYGGVEHSNLTGHLNTNIKPI